MVRFQSAPGMSMQAWSDGGEGDGSIAWRVAGAAIRETKDTR